MYYYCSTKDGYILSVGLISTYDPDDNGYISEERYLELVEVFRSKPKAPNGFDYRLKEDLTWEMYELPSVEESEEATEADYQNSLREMGVRL